MITDRKALRWASLPTYEYIILGKIELLAIWLVCVLLEDLFVMDFTVVVKYT